MQKILIILLLHSLSSKATVLEAKDYDKGTMTVTFIGAEIGDMGTMLLKATNWMEMEMFCKHEMFNAEKKSYLQYINYYNIPTGKFLIKDSICKKLQKLLISTLGGISSSAPLIFILNKKTKKVDKITYPDLDPYLYYADLEDLKLYQTLLN